MSKNKVLNIADWKTLKIKEKTPFKRRKSWEVAMSLSALSHVKKGHEVLGVGAGSEATIFHLCNQGARVWATDRYISAGAWASWANPKMLTSPATFSPVPFDRRNLIVQHMDMLDLHYHDETFDAVFSAGSIEHVGGWQDVERAISEIARVLKPGGRVSLSTEFKLSGDGDGWDGVLLFDEGKIKDHILKPSGLKLTSTPELTCDIDQSEALPLIEFVKAHDVGATLQKDDLILTHDGYIFTSIHLELEKPSKRSAK